MFEKYSNIKFQENPSSGSPVVPFEQTKRKTDRRTDRHGAANCRFSQFSERV